MVTCVSAVIWFPGRVREALFKILSAPIVFQIMEISEKNGEDFYAFHQ